MAQDIRKSGAIEASKKERTVEFIGAALGWAYRDSTTLRDSFDCLVQADEYGWISSIKQMFFPESTELAHQIMNGSYAIQTEDALYDGNESFVICLPKDLTFGGQKVASGILVTILPHEDRETDLLHPFCDWIGVPRIGSGFSPTTGIFGIYICYQQTHNRNYYTRLAMPVEHLVRSLKFDTFTDYKEFLDDFNEFDQLTCNGLNPREMEYQFDAIKLVAGLLAYKKAMPERILNGLPETVKPKAVNSPMIRQMSPQVIHAPLRSSKHKKNHPAMGYYRTWHYRQLMDARFYRGKHEKTKIGRRIILVKSCYVGSDIAAKTVVKS